MFNHTWLIKIRCESYKKIENSASQAYCLAVCAQFGQHDSQILRLSGSQYATGLVKISRESYKKVGSTASQAYCLTVCAWIGPSASQFLQLSGLQYATLKVRVHMRT